MDGFKRNIENKVESLLESFPAVALLGVRQCGKSTLSKMLGPEWKYFDLQRPDVVSLIQSDPILFFKENANKIILDEVQLHPEIFSTLRGVIDDQRDLRGRFILTGSSSFELMKNLSESLAGRIAIAELSPFKMNEFEQTSLSSFFNIFDQKLSVENLKDLKKLSSLRDYNKVLKFLFLGGYPEPVIRENPSFHADWMENYFRTYINRDMRALFPRMDLLKYQRVIRMLSSLSGKILNKSEIARSVECSEKLIRDYLQIIEGTFFWRELPAFKTSLIKTSISSPKGHYRDSGLLFFLQNIFTQEDMQFYPRLGNVFESFVVEEVIRGLESSKAKNLSYSHFRTKAGGEIDLIVEGSFGLLPIEVKHHSNTPKKKLSAMIHFIDKLKVPYGVVINNCERPSLITEKIIQIPAACL